MGFDRTEFNVNEDSQEAVFQVFVFGAIERPIAVQFMTENGTATGKNLLASVGNFYVMIEAIIEESEKDSHHMKLNPKFLARISTFL